VKAESVSIMTAKERCASKCSRTFRGEHGQAVPGGPFPGTQAEEGDVRRCEHGRIWAYVKQTPNDYTIDHWEQLSRFWNPVRFARAARALRSPSPAQGGGTDG
jgi:hypothetical protein